MVGTVISQPGITVQVPGCRGNDDQWPRDCFECVDHPGEYRHQRTVITCGDRLPWRSPHDAGGAVFGMLYSRQIHRTPRFWGDRDPQFGRQQ